MKTSDLIKALQAIDKTVPFDADVVTFGGIYPCSLARVEHDPPHTYLIFDSDESEPGEVDLNELSDDEFNLVIAYRRAPPEVRQAIEAVLATGRLSSSAKS